MSTNIGELGTPRPPVDLSFNYFGVVIRVNESASDLDLIGFMLEAAGIERVDEQRGMVAISNYLRGLVHPEDWDTFWRQARANRQNMEDLMVLGQRIVEAAAGFPTQQSSGSPPGPPTTGQNSGGASSSRASSGPVARTASRTTPTGQALALVPETRPDLREFYVQADEVRAGAAG